MQRFLAGGFFCLGVGGNGLRVVGVGKKQSFLVDIWYFAQALLRDRGARRRFLAQLLIGILVLLVLGNWPLREWVGETPWRFLVWWGMTAFLTIWMLMLAVYDALRVVREIREEEGDS